MFKNLSYIIVVLLFFNSEAMSQTELSFQDFDSLTYSYYKSGDWENLIELGNSALENGIDYKFLRERIGYAYFITGDYVRSLKYFRKAYDLDSYDPFTLAYLYYSNLNIGRKATAGYYLSGMSPDQRKFYQIDPPKVFESIDFELSSEVTSTYLRSNPFYYRFGTGSEITPRISLYQSLSGYSQTGKIEYPTLDYNFRIKQIEYYGILSYSLLEHLNLKTAYHFLHSDFSSSVTYSHLGYAGLSAVFGAADIDAGFSLIDNSQYLTIQSDLKAAFRLPGRYNINFTGGITLMNQQDSSMLIFSGRAGISASRRLVFSADFTYGYQNYYNDFDGMYVYNSIDPTFFRTGITTWYFLNQNVSIWFNTGYEAKEYFENRNYSYYQISILGGLKWRF
jgi:tetratricopeptide (TPR) repeat protein